MTRHIRRTAGAIVRSVARTGRGAAGVVALALFMALQPNMLCGIHCIFYMPVAKALTKDGVRMPMVRCHHRRDVATSSHGAVVGDVVTAPPSRKVDVDMPAGAVHRQRIPRPAPWRAIPPGDLEPPPPRAA